jgi:hypothetical protein
MRASCSARFSMISRSNHRFVSTILKQHVESIDTGSHLRGKPIDISAIDAICRDDPNRLSNLTLDIYTLPEEADYLFPHLKETLMYNYDHVHTLQGVKIEKLECASKVDCLHQPGWPIYRLIDNQGNTCAKLVEFIGPSRFHDLHDGTTNPNRRNISVKIEAGWIPVKAFNLYHRAYKCRLIFKEV